MIRFTTQPIRMKLKTNKETIKLRVGWHELGKMMHHTRKQTNFDDKVVSILGNFRKKTNTENKLVSILGKQLV